jgi:type VI secretion system secreted protein VgrG
MQITQTMQAVATDAQATLQAAAPTPLPATNTPLPTEIPLPTETPAPTATPLPEMTETSTPVVAASNPLATIDQSTHCRSGQRQPPIIYTPCRVRI